MFFSITNLYSVQLKNPYNGNMTGWTALEDEREVNVYLASLINMPYRVATVFNGQILMITHRYCERMLWGFEGFGIGLR